jgi:hypothetical protein
MYAETGETVLMVTVALSPFQRWVAAAISEAGGEVPAELDPLGIAFEAEDRVVRLFPHADEALAVIEVTAVALEDIAQDDVARLAVQLQKLNHEARLEHSWRVVLDDHDRLNVTTTVAVADTGASLLAEIVRDGIGRAASLATIVTGLLSMPASDPDDRAPIGVGAIRG